MPLSLSDVLRLTAKAALNSVDDVFNVYHGYVGSIGTASQNDAIDILRDYVELIYAAINDNLPDNLIYQSIDLFNLTDDEAYGLYNWPTLENGANGGQHMPNSDTAYMFGRTATARHRGAKYLPGMIETAQSDGLWDTAFLASYANALANWITVLTDGPTSFSWIPGVLQAIAPQVIRPFTGGVVRAVVQPLGRRKPGKGS